MKKLILSALVLCALLLPAAAPAQDNALDQAKSIQNTLNNDDLSDSNALGRVYHGGKKTRDGASAAYNNRVRKNRGSAAEDVQANSVEKVKVKETLELEKQVREGREAEILSYAMMVLSLAIFAATVIKLFSATMYGSAIAIALIAATLALVAVGFVKIFKNYGDGLGPSNTVKAIGSVMLGAAALAVTVMPSSWAPALMKGLSFFSFILGPTVLTVLGLQSVKGKKAQKKLKAQNE